MQLEGGFFSFRGGEGCYLKLEKQYFFECVGLGFRVICGYMFGNAVLFPFLFTQFLFGCYCDFILFLIGNFGHPYWKGVHFMALNINLQLKGYIDDI